jgi:hypothetical protein
LKGLTQLNAAQDQDCEAESQQHRPKQRCEWLWPKRWNRQISLAVSAPQLLAAKTQIGAHGPQILTKGFPGAVVRSWESAVVVRWLRFEGILHSWLPAALASLTAKQSG